MIDVSSESGSGLQRIRIAGSLSLAELTELIVQCRDSSPAGASCLVDLTAASALELHFPQIRKLAQLSFLSGFPRPGMRVGVVAPNPVTYGVCRMLQGLRHDLEEGLGVFASEAEATAWICAGAKTALA
jgi:hypothetical protein